MQSYSEYVPSQSYSEIEPSQKMQRYPEFELSQKT
jgi:hypothetical protein